MQHQKVEILQDENCFPKRKDSPAESFFWNWKMSGQYRREFFIFPEELISSPGSVWDGESLHPVFLSDLSRIKEFWLALQFPD